MPGFLIISSTVLPMVIYPDIRLALCLTDNNLIDHQIIQLIFRNLFMVLVLIKM